MSTSLRASIVSLENKCSNLLNQYSTFAQATSSKQQANESKLDAQIEKNLQDRQTNIDDYAQQLHALSSTNQAGLTGKMAQLERHKDVMHQHQKEFNSLRTCIQQERNNMNLLFDVKQDILTSRAEELERSRMYGDGAGSSADDYINEESRRIDKQHNVVDNLISQAWETRDQFSSQRRMLNNANNKMFEVVSKIPGINTLIAKINTRRKKNAVILAGLISCCILVLFFTY
ncbi:hypothetical protein ACO0RG_003681 [Hanseniaspora osmophila]|uniref:Golgi SNAP receptor complex member 1 n=1 Tax=Hanseniaspora osmophila TaxID=56408 RepID=A0A1E5RFM2_9ASCO|nr:Golgi SNAP receptor complex member 1 [Hanseniaspora osmophila]